MLFYIGTSRTKGSVFVKKDVQQDVVAFAAALFSSIALGDFLDSGHVGE